MYAVDDLSDAIDATRWFLTPVTARRWLKLAVVVLFVAGFGLGMPSAPPGDVTPPTEDPVTGDPIESPLPTEQLLLVATVVVAVAVLLWLLFAFVGSLMEFVLVESLRTDDVRIGRYAEAHFGRAVSLFLFRLVLGAAAAIAIGVPAYLALAPIESIGDRPPAALGGVVALAFATYLVYAVIVRLTTEFVVPVMLLEERGIRYGWARFWRTLRGNLAEYAVYVLLASIIGFVAAIAVGILASLTMFVLAIPLALLAIGFLFLGPLGGPFLALLVLAAIATFLLVLSLYRMPVVAYVRYYALLVLGDTDADLDLIPERREAVRARDGPGPGGADEPWTDRPDDAGREPDDGAGWGGSDEERSDDGLDGADEDGGDDRANSAGEDEDDRDGWRYRDE